MQYKRGDIEQQQEQNVVDEYSSGEDPGREAVLKFQNVASGGGNRQAGGSARAARV